MKFYQFLCFIAFAFLCSCQNAKMTGAEMNMQKIDFEEINHVNVKLINSEYQLLKSQSEIDRIYKVINDNNPSPRKNPIPSFSENESYIVIQPKIEKPDFTISEVSGKGKYLQIKIQQLESSEFMNKKSPAIIIKINQKFDGNVELKNEP